MFQTKTYEDSPIFSAEEVSAAFAYVESMWPQLTREQKVDDGTLIGLPHPYVVPSVEPQDGFVFDEMYYWDSFFIAEGLMTSGRLELAEGMLENLIYMARKFHIIPNASRYYHTGRAQPPLLTRYIFDVYHRDTKSASWLEERIHIAEKEYNFVWMSTKHPNTRNVYKNLSRYYEINMLDDLAEAESGWDHTTRFYGQCLSYIPVDLNSLLYSYEIDFSEAYTILGDQDTAEIWRDRAEARAYTMNEELWDNDLGFYFDLNYVTGEKSGVWSLAALYPLWAGLASPAQAARVVENLQKFMYVGGLSTTLPESEQGARDIAHQWSYPNGWAPLHFIACEALSKYGYHAEAEHVARIWIRTNIAYFQTKGVFREAYNVTDYFAEPEQGVYPPQIGFGWTNAVFIYLAKKYLKPEELLMV